MSKLKVWGGNEIHVGRQLRHIVSAPNKDRAHELVKRVCIGTSRYYFDGYWCETGNETELATATEEGVWVETEKRPSKFKRLV